MDAFHLSDVADRAEGGVGEDLANGGLDLLGCGEKGGIDGQ